MSLRDKQVWDLVAQQFHEKIGPEGDPVRRNCVDPMLQNALHHVCTPGASVLDAGSGNGHYLKKLRNAGYFAAGLDISPALLRIARGQCPGIVFHEADLEDPTSLPDGKWDAVVCSFVLDGIQNLAAALGGLYGLLTPGGHLLVNIPHPAFLVPEYWGLQSRKLYVEDDPDGADVFLFKCTLPVKYFWRPVSQYLNAIITTGFNLVSLIEPDPRILDEYFRNTKRSPLPAYMLGIVAKRSD